MSKIVTLTEAASIALHGMIIVAKAEKMANVIHIAELTGSSKHHVAKIFQRLVKDNFLESHRGPTGGFTLKKSPKDISLLEIYESIEGKIEVTTCPLDKHICPFDKCIMDNVTRKMTVDFRDHLKSHTLQDYL
ncbi:MAG: Rrf2 family transcriptional regulator [Bacteroidales bacterium]|jgi:Rrf2 family protein|nr:Rrf2 family transcriptional regulator [Bacteroidales bacterium]MDD4086695.1 Rrf2 family transcriptional regulator [Bacteroidales bacterium]MDY0084780.1 Rrf2 family transcriptional regulator [Bacteroidales bacterium]